MTAGSSLQYLETPTANISGTKTAKTCKPIYINPALTEHLLHRKGSLSNSISSVVMLEDPPLRRDWLKLQSGSTPLQIVPLEPNKGGAMRRRRLLA